MKQPLFHEPNPIRLYPANKPRKWLRWLGYALGAAVFLLYLSSVAQANDTPHLKPDQLRNIFTQALADDGAGEHQRARAWYDALQGTSLAGESAVPSAVNLVVLGRYDEARKAFGLIASNGNARDAAYAQLSLLGLTARNWQGKPADLRKQLATQAAGLRGNDLLHQRLFDLYAGKASVEQAQDVAQAMGGNDAALSDRLAETGYFTGLWQQYVQKDPAAAAKLYQQALPHASASIERPLIEQALGGLQGRGH
ncbi:hypothetical protein LNN38_24680 [Pseudomonas sp. LA21]|uniref:hypothetical protein n=1 Tax=unclassified Pseudomonas TaxID=196821 RepID=UPI001FB598E6|nr:hypothetical protein [Pseudomonas sp. LA21]MCJ1888071.1 hypothetical protein [Pseudomonas sp. LA21]